jgi:hypothetical protein
MKPRDDTPHWARKLAEDLRPDEGYYDYGWTADHIAEFCLEHAEEIWASAKAEEPSIQNENERLRAALQRIADAEPRPKRNHDYGAEEIERLQRTARAALAEKEGE